MSIEITIDGEDSIYSLIDNASNMVENTSDGLMQAVEATALPDVIEASQTVWGIETGDYSSSWNLEVVSSNSVELFNTSDHAGVLEFGWTTRNGTQISSPGVLFPTVQNDVGAIAQELQSWLSSQLQ